MGTRLRRRKKTRREKVEESRGKTPQRLKNQLNSMTIKTDNKEVQHASEG